MTADEPTTARDDWTCGHGFTKSEHWVDGYYSCPHFRSAPAAEADNAGEERSCCGGTRRHRVGCDPNRGNRAVPLSTISAADLLAPDDPRPAVSPGGLADDLREQAIALLSELFGRFPRSGETLAEVSEAQIARLTPLLADQQAVQRVRDAVTQAGPMMPRAVVRRALEGT